MYDGARIQFAVFAELRILSDVAVRVDDTAVSDLGAFFDDGIRHNGDVFADQGFSLMTAVSWMPGSHLFSGRKTSMSSPKERRASGTTMRFFV